MYTILQEFRAAAWISSQHQATYYKLMIYDASGTPIQDTVLELMNPNLQPGDTVYTDNITILSMWQKNCMNKIQEYVEN